MEWTELETGISNLYHWTLEDEIATKRAFYQSLELDLIAESDNNSLNQFNFCFIESILNDIDDLLEMGINHIKTIAQDNPSFWGIPNNEITKYINIELPVDIPRAIFYTDNEWLIQFLDSSYPLVEYGYGIGIFFKDREIVGCEILQEEESIE